MKRVRKRKAAAALCEDDGGDVQGSPARINTSFLARMVTNVSTGNQRVLDAHASNSAHMSLGATGAAALRLNLERASAKAARPEAIRRVVLSAAAKQRLSLCSALMAEVAHGFGFELTIWQPTGDEVTAAQAMAGAAAGPLSPSAAGTAEGGEAGAGAAAAAAPRASLDLQPLFAELQMGPAAMLLAGQGTGKATAAAASGQAAAGPRPRLSMMGGRLSASALGSIGLGARKGAAAGAATSVAGAAGANAAALARKRALLRAHSAGADAAAAAEAGALGAAADAAAAATAAKQGADATAAPPTSGHGRRIVWNPDGSLSIAPAAAAKQAPAGAEAQAAPQFGDGVPAASSLAGAAQEHKGEATRRSAAPAATAVGAAGLGAAGRAARARISWAAGQSEEASTPGVESPVRDSARGAAGGEEEAAFEQRPAGTRPCLAAHSSGPPGAAPRQHQVLAAAAGSGQDSGGVAEAGARQPDQGEELMDEEDGPDPHAGTQAGHGVSAGAAAAARGRSGQRHGPVANGGGTEALQGGAEGGEEERGKGSRRLQEDEDEDGPQGAPQEGAETDEVPAAPSRRATGRLAGRLGAAVTPGAGLGAAAAAAAAAQGGAAAPGGPTPRSSSGAKREPRGLAGSLFGAAMRGLHRSSVSSDRP